MTRKRKGAAPASRQERRGAPGPSPLLVIAGLPAATAGPAAATINNNSAQWHAVASPFPARDQGFYADDGAILALGAAACCFAAKDARDRNGIRTPSRIAVAYVAADDAAHLWDLFGHAVWPIALEHPDWRWANGKHWRHEIETVNRVIARALATVRGGQPEATRLRLEARRRDDPLLLPGRNFHLEGGGRLVERFRAFMRGELDLAGIEEDVRRERFTFEQLSGFYARMGGSKQVFAVDSRDIVFAKANVGQDGGLPQFDVQVSYQAAVLQRVLESRYRFGAPLEPAGFQHDVQREGGHLFDHEPFDCVTKGPIEVSGDHANIYPSDVVTGQIVG